MSRGIAARDPLIRPNSAKEPTAAQEAVHRPQGQQISESWPPSHKPLRLASAWPRGAQVRH